MYKKSSLKWKFFLSFLYNFLYIIQPPLITVKPMVCFFVKIVKIKNIKKLKIKPFERYFYFE